MDVFDLYAKISLDTSEYESGVSTAKKSSQQYKSDVMKLATQYKKSGMDMSEAMKKAYSEIDKSAYESSSTTQKSTKKAKDAFEELGDSAKDAADKTGNSWDDISSSIKSIESKFSTLTTAFKANFIVDGIKTVASGLLELEEATEEYRTAQGKLNTAFEAAGYSADVAQEAYSGLYAILGDTDTATEAAQLMAKLTDSAEDVSEWVNIAAGAYGTFGDALPINSLIEATNETVKVGEVTGVLADALNWAGISEDDFNAKLADCSNEAERNQLVMETLSDTYSDASDAFYENNEQLVQNRENQQKLDDAMAEVGDSVSRLKNAFLNEYTPAIETAAGATANFLDTLANPSTWASIGEKLTWFQTFSGELITGSSISEAKATAERIANQYYRDSGEAARQAAKEVQAAYDSVVSNAQKNAFILQQNAKKAENSADSIAESYETVSKSASSSSKSVSSAAKTSTTAVKESTEKEKSYLEKLQESYKETSSALNTELGNIELSYKLWAEQIGDSATESEQLAKELENLNQQYEAQQKIVDAAQKAYDDFAASQEYTEEGAAELENTLLQEQLALAKLQTEINDTSSALSKATDETEQFKTALDTAFEETNNFGSAISSLGSSASDLGDVLGIDLVSDIGAMISKMGGGISSVINFANSLIQVANSVSTVTSALSNLASIASTVSSGGGLLSTIGSIFGGSTGVLGTLALGGAAVGAVGTAEIIKDNQKLWNDESKSFGEKLFGTISNGLWAASGVGTIIKGFETIFGKKEKENALEDSASNVQNSIKDQITTGTVSGVTTSGGDTIIERVEIFIEGSQYKDEDSLAEAISIKLQNLTERKVNVFA